MLTGKTALITGGSRGIGKVIALEMAAQGADVLVGYSSNATQAEEVCREAIAKGVRAAAVLLHVDDEEQSAEAVKTAIATFGKVDILVNNAGITRDGMLLTMKEEDYDAVLNVNLKGVFHMTKFMGMHFLRRKQGVIVNISSVTGLMGNPGQANYTAAKAGVIGLTKTSAKELASRNIRVNAIAPGFIETDMTAVLSESQRNNISDAVPLKRFGTPEDVAKLAAFLASDDAGYITGEVIKVDGGLYV